MKEGTRARLFSHLAARKLSLVRRKSPAERKNFSASAEMTTTTSTTRRRTLGERGVRKFYEPRNPRLQKRPDDGWAAASSHSRDRRRVSRWWWRSAINQPSPLNYSPRSTSRPHSLFRVHLAFPRDDKVNDAFNVARACYKVPP